MNGTKPAVNISEELEIQLNGTLTEGGVFNVVSLLSDLLALRDYQAKNGNQTTRQDNEKFTK